MRVSDDEGSSARTSPRDTRGCKLIGSSVSNLLCLNFQQPRRHPQKSHRQLKPTSTMSKATDLNENEYESANGSPEKKIGDTEVQGDEGEESDEYEEIDDDEVCVQRNKYN